MTVSVAEHCRRIKAHIAKGDKAAEKSEQHYRSAGHYLHELKEHIGTWAEWEALLKKKIGISTGRASELMQVADGRKTVEKLRADKAESVRQVRARASSLRSEETTALVKAEQAPADDPAASAENMKAQFAALDEDAAKVDDDGGAEGAELNRFTRRVQKFHTEFYNALQKWCEAHPDPAHLPEDQRVGLVGALRHVANDVTLLAQRLDPERLKETVARYIAAEERAESAIAVSPAAEPAEQPADGIEPPTEAAAVEVAAAKATKGGLSVLGKDRLTEIDEIAMDLALAFRPVKDEHGRPDWKSPGDELRFERYLRLAYYCAKARAPYESPRLAAIAAGNLGNQDDDDGSDPRENLLRIVENWIAAADAEKAEKMIDVTPPAAPEPVAVEVKPSPDDEGIDGELA